MPVDIHNMRSEVTFQSPTENTSQPAQPSGPSYMDQDQLRDAIREVVLEVISEDIYTTFRARGRR